MALQERERELAELDAAFEEAGAGRGCAVAIEGRAGLGKTRLLSEARAAAADAGFTVLTARATDLERDFPFALVRQLYEAPLASLTKDEREGLLEGSGAARGALGLDPGGGGTHDSFAVLHGLYWVTAALADKKPLLLAIDDAHSADAASLDYLGFLLPRLEELPVLVVLAARTDEPDPPDGLGRILTDASARHLALAPLSAAAATALLAQELGRQPEPSFATACYEVSGGNPFLVCELGRTLVEQRIEPVSEQVDVVRKLAPERVARMVLRRIGRLPPAAGAVARALAVLEEGSDFRLVAELAGIEPEAARRAADELRASAIFGPGASMQFVHPLVRNAIYSDIPEGEREEAHSRAATLLRARDSSPERIATQLLASHAGEDPATVQTLLEAGERALATGAPRSAIAYLTRALAEPPPAELRAAVLSSLLTAIPRAADHSVFPAIEADIFAEMERDPSQRGRWAVKLTLWMAFGEGRFDEAAALLEEGIEVAVSEGDMESAFRLEGQLSTTALMLPGGPEARPEARLARYASQIDPDSPGGHLAAALEVFSALEGGTAEEVADAAKRALGNDGLIFAEEPEFIASIMVVTALGAAGELDAARRAAERALAIAHERGGTPDFVRGWYLRGLVSWAHGDVVAAEADVRQATDLARLAGVAPVIPMVGAVTMMEILIARDELEAVEQELQAWGLASGPIPEHPVFSLARFVRGHLRLERGEFDQAAEDFANLGDEAQKMALGPGPVTTASAYAARALMAIGEETKARELTEEIAAMARRWGAPIIVAQALRGVAITRDPEQGVELLEEAAAMMASSPSRLQRAEVLVDLGAALRRGKRRVDAREPLREGLRIARQCGAVRLAKYAHDELQATGETVRTYTPIGAESLTPSERRVAELAASGMTNRQIAQSLFVTVKTVEAHLSAAYDKLDIGSRQQLGAALAGPSDPIDQP